MAIDAFQAVRLRAPDIGSVLANLPSIELLDDEGRNLLHESISSGNSEAGMELIRLGISVNVQDCNGQTPLHFTGIHNNAAFAKAILSSGGDLLRVDRHGNTPLWSAVVNARGNHGTVRVMMDAGGSQASSMKNKAGRSPLDFARQISDSALIAMLSVP